MKIRENESETDFVLLPSPPGEVPPWHTEDNEGQMALTC
jgi:hypothetical protein